MVDAAKILWDRIRSFIYELGKMDADTVVGVEDVLRDLHNAADMMARVHDPPLISRDYLWTIVDLARKVRSIDYLLSELKRGRMEFAGRLREEVAGLYRSASLVYKAYRGRVKLLAFTILTPLIIAGLDLLIIGFNGWFGVVVLLLGGLAAISLPLSYILYSVLLMALSSISIVYAGYYNDFTITLAVLLYSILGTITGVTTYYAGSARWRLYMIIEEILRSPAPKVVPVPVVEEKVSEDVGRLLERLREEYRRLYGSEGDSILEYRIALIQRAGYTREQAIKRLADELKISDKNNLEEK